MTLDQIKKIVEKGESSSVEFKKSIGAESLSVVFKTVCAFLNGEGGVILIGVTDSGKIVGQEVSDKTRREIANGISELEPPAQSQIAINYEAVDNQKQVIVIKVRAGDHIPYIFDGRPFHRVQSTTSKMPQHRYEQLIKQRGQLNHSWEEMLAVKEFVVGSLDNKEIQRTIEHGVRFNRIPPEALHESIEDALIRLGLLKNGQLNHAAVALFGNELFPNYSQCMIKLARFRGTNNLGDFIDNQQIYGNSFKLLSAASDFLMRHLPIASFFQENKFERIDKPTLPVLAVREALINAICHRDYSDSVAYISLAIFDDRLEIWSYGTLPPQLKIEDLKHKHNSYLRNKLISQVFYSRGLIEKWATGINKMISMCKDENIPEPKFEEYSNGFAVIFKFAEPIGVSSINTKDIALDARQNEILAIIEKHGAASLKLINSELVSTLPKSTLQKELKKLKQLGLIDLRGSTNKAEWVNKTLTHLKLIE